MIEIIKNNKLVVFTFLGILASSFAIFGLMPILNTLISIYVSIVPQAYLVPISSTLILTLGICSALWSLKYLSPKIKNFSAQKFDKPSLAVILSGSSGLGIYRKFKSEKDQRFSASIKGFLFNVHPNEGEKKEVEGSIHGYKFPVEPAKDGYRGANGARNTERESAIDAFVNFFKPFSKELSTIVRITGIGEGYTSITCSSEYSFVDMKDFGKNAPKNSNLIDFVLVGGINLKDKTKKKLAKYKGNIVEIKNYKGETIQNGIVDPKRNQIITPFYKLKKYIANKNPITITNNLDLEINDAFHTIEYEHDEKLIKFNFDYKNGIGWDYIDDSSIKLTKNKLIREINDEQLKVSSLYQLNSELCEDKYSLIDHSKSEDFVLTDKEFKPSNIGSPLLSEDGKLIGIVFYSNSEGNISLRIKEKVSGDSLPLKNSSNSEAINQKDFDSLIKS